MLKLQLMVILASVKLPASKEFYLFEAKMVLQSKINRCILEAMTREKHKCLSMVAIEIISLIVSHRARLLNWQ